MAGSRFGQPEVMPIPELHCEPPTPLQAGLDRIRHELGIPEEFPADVLDEAEAAAAQGETQPEPTDLTELPFVTIDPPGSRDLDQAVLITPTDTGGHLVRYAIADVAAFVRPDGAIDAEAARRGVTIYLPDRRPCCTPRC